MGHQIDCQLWKQGSPTTGGPKHFPEHRGVIYYFYNIIEMFFAVCDLVQTEGHLSDGWPGGL